MSIFHQRRGLASAFLLFSALAVAGCDSSDERAQRHLEKAFALIEENDTVAAELELRNALKLNRNLHQAHMALADIRREAGNIQSAVGHYLKVIELDETALDARVRLGGIMLQANQLDEALRHAQAAAQIAPDNIEVLSLRAGVAVRLENYETAVNLASRALLLDPDASEPRLVLASVDARNDNLPAAMDQVRQAIERNPDDVAVNLFHIQLLQLAGRMEEAGPTLERLIEIHPEQKQFHEALVRWHLGQGDIDSAEAAIRAYAASLPDNAGAALSVVQFLGTQRGPEIARAELEKLIAGAPDDAARFPYEIAMVQLETSTGQADEALARMKAIVDTYGDSTEGNNARVRLAGMLLQRGENAEATALVDTVLAEDERNATALSTRAQLHIRADRYEEAIQDARLAQTEAPEDWRFMLIEAEAHKLNGSSSLAGERMAAAVETSNYNALTVLTYAQHLFNTGKADFAETLIEDGLARDPDNTALLGLLARLKVTQQDWLAAEKIAERLRQIEGGEGASNALMAQVMLRDESRGDKGLAVLEDIVDEQNAARSSMAAMVAAYARSDRTDKAEEFLDRVLNENPDNVAALILRGDLKAHGKDAEGAEAAYRSAIDAAPDDPAGHRALVTYLLRSQRVPDAIAAAQAGLEQVPDVVPLRLTLAMLLEREGDVPAAITEYETLYERVPSSFLVANNLASLIMDKDPGPEQIERAFVIAKRLRDSDQPHYKDTYGWLLYLRGEPEKAVRYLKPAAEALPEVMLAQFHLGMAYAKMGLAAQAREALERAIALGEGQDLPQIAEAKSTLAALPADE